MQPINLRMSTAPIALFTYNRPAHTRLVVESLLRNAEAAASDLFIFSDAPKAPEQVTSVSAVREYVSSITGFRKIQIVERERNLGLARSIVDGVNRLCASHGRAIVLEDDIEVSPFFLRFMNEALDRYSDDKRVTSIGAYTYPIDAELPETYFLRLPESWGWAVWKRSWDLYEADGAPLLAELRRRRLEHEFDLEGSHGYTQMLADQLKGKNDSWAVRWHAKTFLRGGLTLYPGRSLTRNLGMDGSGVHCAVTSAYDVELADRPVRLQDIPVAEDPKARAGIVSFFSRPSVQGWRIWLRRAPSRIWPRRRSAG
jgi:hypothetical protein